MNFKYLCLIMILMLAAFVNGSPLKAANSEEVSIIELEEGCVRQGGICMKVEDCDPGNLVQIRGILCPKQSHLNVECCYL